MRHYLRRGQALFAGLLLATLLLGLMPVPQAAASHARWCPPQTGVCTENAFLDFWRAVDEATGGYALDIIGYPIDSPRRSTNNGLIVQFFERAIMEWHPENPTQYQVLLTRLGAFLVEDREDLQARAAQPPIPCRESCALFDETNHTLRGIFAAYWLVYGGLPVYGYPLTEEFLERNAANGQVYTVQYFERNRFEYHPENAGKYQVLLGRLGAETLALYGSEVRGWPVVVVPHYF